ncbi:hypothetical protein OS128_07610 [Corynebacterium sp. P5848]|uniref:hypothetical protein n=1 Tax=Corynebacterium marambiense TaxID=2765364 RepID=UPI0022608C7D|nr:hypothetical protein [Corynebacterium marambiense]MCX7542778.1 hypothetical protein [Corynebacterium marambiense]
MKLLSRKSLVSAAAVIAMSTSGLTAPAMATPLTLTQPDAVAAANDETPKEDGSSVDKITKGSSEGSSADESSEGSSGETKTCLKNGKEKPCSTLDYYVSKISGWVKMLTTVASLFTAIFAISNAIQKVTKIAG